MKSLLKVCLLLSFLSLFSYTHQARITFKSVKYENASSSEPHGFIFCVCDGGNRLKELPKNRLDEVSLFLVSALYCSKIFPADICDLMTDCSICTLKTSTCSVASNATYSCVQKEMIIHGGNSTVKSHGFRKRPKRTSEKCQFPTTMKTSNLHCVETIKTMKCVQVCIYGYTLQEGISRKMICKYSENVWKPTGFEECSPFIDCTMNLISPGSLHCVTGTTDLPPQCEVSCDPYEDYQAVSLKTYHCNAANSGWTEKLPHCVTSGSGVYLVPEPRLKIHSEEEKLKSQMDLPEKGRKVSPNRGAIPALSRMPRMMARRKKQRKLFRM